MFNTADHTFMTKALALAELGLYSTTPNPRVGCLIVREERVIGAGWHQRAGEAHAEINALNAVQNAGHSTQGASAYVTLEPCSHTGRTPPCTKALIAAGISRVVVAMLDPNPLVAGKGVQQLTQAGIKVELGLLEDAAQELNIGFVSRMTRARPWLRSKLAASLDGKTALNNGQSQWITGVAARADGHTFRARACAILSGIGTLNSDDPELTVRGIENARQPLKVLIDSRLELSLSAKVLHSGRILLVCAQAHNREKIAAFERLGVEVIALPNAANQVDLPALMLELGRRELNEVHVEAGARLNGALLSAGLIDEFLLYLAPCFIGHHARGLFDFPALESLAQKQNLQINDFKKIGTDLRILARVQR